MLAATVNGQDCWLVAHEFNSRSTVELTVSFATEQRRALTGPQTRRNLSLAPRFALAWSSLLDPSEFAALRAASLVTGDRPILAPVWPHRYRPGDDEPTLSGGLVVAWDEGWSTWAINPADATLYDFAAPLVFGRFDSPPRLRSLSGALLTAEFKVTEDAPVAYALAVPDGILPADTVATVGGASFPVFPFAPDWSAPPSPGVGVYEVERIVTGPGRMRAVVYYPQTPETVFSAQFTGFGAREAAQFIAWWVRRGGAAAAHVVSPADLGIQGGGSSLVARHTSDALTLRYYGPAASVTLGWRELAAETSLPPGETLGTTVGQLARTAWFFRIDLDHNGALRTWRLTNWESGAFADGQSWDYNACKFDRLVQSIDLEDDAVQVTFRYFAGGPWDNWLPGNLAARGFLTVYRGDVDAAGTLSGFRQVCRGELQKPTADGPIVTQRASGSNGLFSRRAPRQVMSTTCGTMLFRPRCGLALGDWTFSASIVAVSGNVVTVGSISRDNGAALPGGFGAAEWFALGWVQWSGAGGAPFRDGILASAAISSGQIVLTLDRACTLAGGTAVKLVPGCNRLGPTCRAKFENYPRFRGFELMPSVSPSLVVPQRKFQPAKK